MITPMEWVILGVAALLSHGASFVGGVWFVMQMMKKKRGTKCTD
jgi:hypothetical protein